MAMQRTILRKRPAESRLYVFNFTSFPEVIAGGALSSPAVPASDPGGLTIGTPSVTAVVRDGIAVGKGVEVQISGGTAGTDYAVEARVTIAGSVCVVPGTIKVG